MLLKVEPSVVTLGEAMLRLSPPDRGRLADVETLRAHVAGSEANVAVALASLGVPTRWVSALPENPLGRRVQRELAAAGVDLAGVEWAPRGRVGLFFVEFGAAPRATSVVYDRAGSAFAAMDVFREDLLDGARFAVVSGVTPALGRQSRALTERFVAAARARGAGLCVDVNYRARLWGPEEARAGLADLLRAAEIVVCSTRDARTVFGCTGDATDVLAELQAEWAPDAAHVVVTCGVEGAVSSRAAGGPLRQDAIATEVVDRFGAGDAFVAGLLWGLMRGTPEFALRAAVALGALKCTVTGDLARFSADELEAVIDHPGTVLVR